MNTSHIADDVASVYADDQASVRDRFREVLAHFGSGVVVITSAGPDGSPVGMTVGSFTSISMEPPLVGFFAGITSTTLPSVVANGSFCANVLSEDQHVLARTFARSGADKFAGVEWTPSGNGSLGWQVHMRGSSAPSTSTARSAITSSSWDGSTPSPFPPPANR